MAFSQNPNHITGRNRRISRIGTPGATPRIRSASDALMPATSPMPTVWHDRMAGKANTDGDSRIQVLKSVDSSQTKKAFMARETPQGYWLSATRIPKEL